MSASPLVSEVNPQTSWELADQRERIQQWREKIGESKNMPEDQAISLLGRCLVGMSQRSNFQLDERWDVYREAQEALLAIPEHANYYEESIKSAQRKHVEAFDAGRGGIFWPELEIAQRQGFATLAHLPSPETVRVLGEFLLDETTTGLSVGHGMKEGPNAYYAVRSIALLPLVNPPVKADPRFILPEEILRPWQLWYLRVKAGEQTFRFEGDPHEYNLRGVVGERGDTEPGREKRRPDAVAMALEANPGEHFPRGTWAVIVAAAGLVGAAGVYWRKSRAERPDA